MIDIEGVFQSLDGYLTAGVTYIGAAVHALQVAMMYLSTCVRVEENQNLEKPFGPDEDMADAAFRRAAGLNGRALDQKNYKGPSR